MAYDGWVEFNDVELINLSRTAQLAGVLGLDTVWVSPSQVEWIEDTLGGTGYTNVATAPWYDAGYPASSEFAGIVPLSLAGLDDSSLTSDVTEYVTDGGHAGKARNATQTVVANVALVASTDRGAEYGKRWMDRVLRGSSDRQFCAGSDLRYFRYAGTGAPRAHRRDVRVTRGSNVTRKRVGDCSSTWLVTFTLTADDPYEYGEAQSVLAGLGGTVAPSGAADSGTATLTETLCPVYDYSPLYDPLNPALVAAPSAPDFYPTGWTTKAGDQFKRYWARINPVEPSALNVVPVFTLTTDTEARMVRVSVWPSDSVMSTEQCDPLFSATITYLPSGVDFIIDGERKASYLWDGLSPTVRRTDSLVYGVDAKPVEWAAFNDHTSLFVTLDTPLDAVTLAQQGGGTIRAELALVPKSN